MQDKFVILKKRMDKMVKNIDFQDLVDLLDSHDEETSSPSKVEKMIHKIPSYYAVVSYMHEQLRGEIDELITKEELFLSKLSAFCEHYLFEKNREEGMTASASKPKTKQVDGMIHQLVFKVEKKYGDEEIELEEEDTFEGKKVAVPLFVVRRELKEKREKLGILSTLKKAWDKKIDTEIAGVNLIGNLLKKDLYVVKDDEGYRSG